MARSVFTSTPLAGSASWQSDTITPEAGDNLVGIAFSDQAGTVQVLQSTNGGTNFDWTSGPITVTAGAGKEFSVPVYGNAVAVLYTNGVTPQTVFRLRARISSSGPRN